MNRVIWMMPLLTVFGCAHKPEIKTTAPGEAAAPAAAAPSTSANVSSSARTCRSDLDCGDKQLCLNNKCIDITPELAECTNVRVHFPFNSDEIDSTDKAQLDRSARCLKADHALHVTIEGNADERGTEEYNMALGDRRARAVAHYLESLGASDSQVATVSFGKENPECKEHDETCWARNRRAALKADGKKK
jgi:peptidoglycan-associated lipoprotein